MGSSEKTTNIFLTGCNHFGHDRIIELAKRPFSNVSQMNKEMVSRWNSVVSEDDTVFVLGDLSCKGLESVWYESSLNGELIRLQGDHDEAGWGKDYMEIIYKGLQVVLFHYPIQEWNGFFRGSVHFHAHTHSKEFVTGERRGSVGVDANNFYPVHIDDALARLGVEIQN